MATTDETTAALEKAREALRFYAHGGHSTRLSGAIDWKAERANMEARGFSCAGEWPSGDEEYVEDGRTAQEALDAIDVLMTPNAKVSEGEK